MVIERPSVHWFMEGSMPNYAPHKHLPRHEAYMRQRGIKRADCPLQVGVWREKSSILYYTHTTCGHPKGMPIAGLTEVGVILRGNIPVIHAKDDGCFGLPQAPEL